MKKTLFIILLLVVCLPHMNAQGDIRTAAGSWIGKLQVSGVTLRIIFNISLVGNDSLAVTLDSPDQGAKGIKIGPVTLKGNDIKISASMLKGEYNGTITNDTLITGKWTQAGMTYPLDL